MSCPTTIRMFSHLYVGVTKCLCLYAHSLNVLSASVHAYTCLDLTKFNAGIEWWLFIYCIIHNDEHYMITHVIFVERGEVMSLSIYMLDKCMQDCWTMYKEQTTNCKKGLWWNLQMFISVILTAIIKSTTFT